MLQLIQGLTDPGLDLNIWPVPLVLPATSELLADASAISEPPSAATIMKATEDKTRSKENAVVNHSAASSVTSLEIPPSVGMSEEEAAVCIQAHVRGHFSRKNRADIGSSHPLQDSVSQRPEQTKSSGETGYESLPPVETNLTAVSAETSDFGAAINALNIVGWVVGNPGWLHPEKLDRTMAENLLKSAGGSPGLFLIRRRANNPNSYVSLSRSPCVVTTNNSPFRFYI